MFSPQPRSIPQALESTIQNKVCLAPSPCILTFILQFPQIYKSMNDSKAVPRRQQQRCHKRRTKKLLSEYLRLKSPMNMRCPPKTQFAPPAKSHEPAPITLIINTEDIAMGNTKERVLSVDRKDRKDTFLDLLSRVEIEHCQTTHLDILDKVTASVISTKRTRYGGFISPMKLNNKLRMRMEA